MLVQSRSERVCVSASARVRARTGVLVVIAAVCLLGATPAGAAGGIGIGSGRLIPSVAALVGLMGVVLGGVALGRSARGAGQRKPTEDHTDQPDHHGHDGPGSSI